MCPTIRVGSEWAVNIQRDSYTSYIGHTPLLSFFGIAENESVWSGAMHLHAGECCLVGEYFVLTSGEFYLGCLCLKVL
jgi:hypothetical protein